MPCSFYPCQTCRRFVRSTAVAVSGTALQITIPAETFRNREPLCLCITQSIPDGVTNTTTVEILITGSTTPIPLITECGNPVYADQIRSRRIYHLTAATGLPAFMVHDRLCCTSHEFPTLPVAATPATLSVKKEGK